MNTPLITALIDTYNHEKYIEQALTSVVEQGLSPSELEIVVVDDGSTDKTPAIIQKFAPRVRHIRKRNGGQASAFNAGFAEARGELVALLDGDDWWAPGKLVAVAGAFAQNPEVQAVGHGHYKFFEETGELQICAPSARIRVDLTSPDAVRSWLFLLMGALTVRRKVFEWIAPIPEEMRFMADSAIQAAATVMGALILPEPLFYYRCHDQNLYAIGGEDVARYRRRVEMAEIAYGGVYRRLLELGVAPHSAFALLGTPWLDAKRARLQHSGGQRLEAFQTEMRLFRASIKNPSLGYRLFKYLVVGTGTLLLPPRRFYQFRDWYGKQGLGRQRERLVKADASERGDR